MDSCTNLDNPRIAIVGSGAIGGYFGGCLANAGFDVRFLMRSDLQFVRENGLGVKRAHAPSFSIKGGHCYGSTGEIGPCDLVIVAIQSTVNHSLASLIPPLLKNDTVVLCLQNGLGNVELMQKLFGVERVVGGIVHMGINRVARGHIENYNPDGGVVTIGEPLSAVSERVMKICSLMQAARIVSKASNAFQQDLWRKLIWNVPFNGLSVVIEGATTDIVISTPHLAELAKALMKEVQVGARALRIDIPDSFIDYQFGYTRNLGAYKPSSMLDFIAGKPVEVEAIWGEPYRRGTGAGASMPCLGMLYALIRTLVNRPHRVQLDLQRMRGRD